MDFNTRWNMKKELMEDKDLKIKHWVFRQTETVSYNFVVPARTRAEARELVEDSCESEYKDYDSCDYIKSGRMVSDGVQTYTRCPNVGRAFTDISLDTVTFTDKGEPQVNGKSIGWHYNGACEVIAEDGETHCYECRSSMNKGYRFTTLKENAYLNAQYQVGLIE
tara:strand:+ start:1387 stop:1881 length:495 start_codon:yes stop_codon:yes gene_type:complete